MSSVQVTMPQLGETVAEGTVVRWLVDVGGEVRANEPLLEVSTDKVDTEVASPADGVLASVVVGEDETVPVGTLLATVDTATGEEAGDEPDSDRTEYGMEDAVPVASTASGATPTPTPREHGEPRHRASPRARRLARERGVDLAALTTAGARVTASDVLAAAGQAPDPWPAPDPGPAAEPTAAPTPAAARGERVEKLSRRRRVIAERMHRSLHESAQLTTVVEVDLTRVVRAREAAKDEFRRRHDAPLTVLAFVAEAAVRALDGHPVVNARLDMDAGTVTYRSAVHLGIAVDTDEGLVVPVVRDAQDLSVGGLARRIADLAARTRDGTVHVDQLSGGTFTITNTGSRGALFDTPILNSPEAAILGLGAAVRRPVVLAGADGEDRIAVRSMAYLALTYDHRLVDGADAARFLGAVRDRLERHGPAGTDPVL